MHKGLIAFIGVAGIVFALLVIIFIKIPADKARAENNKILQKFKTIDKDLQKSSITIDSLNTGTGIFDSSPQNSK